MQQISTTKFHQKVNNRFKGMSAMNVDLLPTEGCPLTVSFTTLLIAKCVFKNKLVFDYTTFIPQEKLLTQQQFVYNESHFIQNLPVSFPYFG